MLNELAPDRSKILRRLFPDTPLFGVNAEQINDYLARISQPSVVLMNPPFSSSPKINSRNPDATPRHINSALQRLVDGGRLVTITATLEIELTPTQERIYNSYSDAFQVIHNNLEKALEACNISGAKTYNRAAKMSATNYLIDVI
ncbi:hypothetical protein [Nostoc sp. WHI]|uniref:hypothetical protein n=1 Tax=Nostoc sp. WHI TaxID=2650611 RepID=UPI001E361984|nr:hypothetical protein [Nostoc sp. WHI]